MSLHVGHGGHDTATSCHSFGRSGLFWHRWSWKAKATFAICGFSSPMLSFSSATGWGLNTSHISIPVIADIPRDRLPQAVQEADGRRRSEALSHTHVPTDLSILVILTSWCDSTHSAIVQSISLTILFRNRFVQVMVSITYRGC